MCPNYVGSKRDWHWIGDVNSPEEALQKFKAERPTLAEAGICILHLAKVIK